MSRRLSLFLLLWLSGLVPVASRAMEYLCQFPASDRVTISGIAADQSGNTYICGSVSKPGVFPGSIRIGATNTIEPGTDAFIMKLDADGTRLVTTLFGGEGLDGATRIAVDSSGDVVVLGSTTSRSFPVVNAFQNSMNGSSDLFITKFDSSCTNLIFSTYIGGRDGESSSALGIDGQDEIYFAGSTWSDDFPSDTDPFAGRSFGSIAFLAKLSSDGSQLRFANRIGGSDLDTVTSLAVDNADNVYLAGESYSADFPTLNALQPVRYYPIPSTPFYSYNRPSAFVTKVGPNGATIFSTFLSGDYYDTAQAIAVNAAGEIFVAGLTHSSVFPAFSETNAPSDPRNASPRKFFVKLDGAGTTILATHFYGLSGFDRSGALVATPDSHVVGVGNSGAIGLPFFVNLDGNNSASMSAARPDCTPMASVEAMTFDATGRLIVAGLELAALYPFVGSYVARYETSEWREPSPVHVRILWPYDGATVPSGKSSSLRAGVMGATGEVSSVKFYDGRRLIGLSTNSPFEVAWKNVSRRTHSLMAVATIGGQSVTSCVVKATAASPRNDNFARRILLRGENVEITGTLAGASDEEPVELYPEPSVWYCWKAPRDGIYQLDVSDVFSSGYQSHDVSVFSGSRLKSLVTLIRLARSSTTLRARRGDVFQIRVSSFSGESSQFRLQLRRVMPPANDNFINATVLSGESLSVIATTRHATDESRGWYVPPDQGYAGEPTVWFDWTAPSSGVFLAAVTGAGHMPVVECHTGDSISNLIPVGQNISGETNGVAFHAQAGTRYFLSLRGDNTNDLILSISPRSPPPNDNFTNRFTIPFGLNSATGSLIGATMEPGEPGRIYPTSPSDASVWWTWRPGTTGVYRVTATPFTAPIVGVSGYASAGTPRDTRDVRVYSGESMSQLRSVSSGSTSLSSTFRAAEGTDYHIAVRGGFARFALDIRAVESPINDNFAAAIPLAGARVVKAGSTIGATTEVAEPPHNAWRHESVWYRWTAPSNESFAISAAGASFSAQNNVYLAVYEGEELAELVLLAAGADTHVIQVTGGVEYRLAVVDAERFTLDIRPARRPANDDFANRQTVSGLHVLFGSNAQYATAEPGEPPFDLYWPAKHTVWFSWTAPTNGSFLLRSTNYDAVRLSVFNGETLTALQTVASDDNSGGIEFYARAGITYQISAEPGYHTWQYPSALNLELRYQPPPRNDNFANRLRLIGSRVSITASNVGATLEPGEPLNSPDARGHTVWWTWRAPRTGRASFIVTNFYGHLGVYTGNGLSQLTPLTDTNSYGPDYNLPVQAGVDYQISVDRVSWGGIRAVSTSDSLYLSAAQRCVCTPTTLP